MSEFKPGDVVEITPEGVRLVGNESRNGFMSIRVVAFCDGCGTTEEHNYLVREDSTKADRFEAARIHLRNKGWSCDGGGDYCPDCKAVAS